MEFVIDRHFIIRRPGESYISFPFRLVSCPYIRKVIMYCRIFPLHMALCIGKFCIDAEFIPFPSTLEFYAVYFPFIVIEIRPIIESRLKKLEHTLGITPEIGQCCLVIRPK